MKIKNAKIKNVNGVTYDNFRIGASMEFHYQTYFKIFVFKLENPVELGNFKKLIEFTESKDFKEMEGKIIRVAEEKDVVKAIGHPIEDRFVDVTNTMINIIEEVTEAELFKNYSET